MHRLLLLIAIPAAALHAETALVLPFVNHSKSANLEWIGESIAESVRDSLASQGILALDREDRLEAYRRLSLRSNAELTHASILKVGESLDASKVIYGYFELLADPGKDPGSPPKPSLRITARIMDRQRTRQGAPFSEVGALEDLDVLQTHLGWQLLASLDPRTAPAELEYMRVRPAVRLDAVESYIRGLLAVSAEQRHHYFTQAARLNVNYSQPCFHLGKIYWEKKDYRVAAGWLERVAPTDPHYLEARFFLALCKYMAGDFKSAEQYFEMISTSLPLNEIYNDLGVAQAQRGDLAAAAVNFRKALEGDDADPDYHFNLGAALWRAGQYAASADSFRAVLARNSNDNEATSLLGRSLSRQAPRPGDVRPEGKFRVKTNYEESAFRQLQAELGAKR
jgi:tetratricopeptide (TPR) repeat protein